MPLLGKEPFERIQLPEDIGPEDDIYFCKTTNEAFLTYDQFFERQILCSSMVWTCGITGRTGLTFEEALESEENASHMLCSFPLSLQIPALYLMNYIKYESKFGSIVDMIFSFISNRYFIGEEIENHIKTKKKICGKVMKVIPPTYSQIINCKTSPKTWSYGESPDLYNYDVLHSDGNSVRVGSQRLSRIKGVLTKDRLRLFLKQHLISPKRFQPMTVKESSIEKLKLDSVKWLDIFSGPEPKFADEREIAKSINKQKDGKHSISDLSEGSLNVSTKSKSSVASTSGYNKNSSHSKKSIENLNAEEKQKQREEAKHQRLEQKKLEKELKKQFDENMKEWNAKREDLTCDDLLPLPKPTLIKCQIPIDMFGDTLVIIEFLHSFSDLFDLKSIFPCGITFDLMQQILFDNDIHGPFGDLLKIMLTSVLTLEEEEEEKINMNHDRDESSDDEVHIEEEKNERYVITPDDKNANYYHCWIQQYLGQPLSQLILDPFTITEVLRLHLLSSGAGPKPRLKHRGLYHSREDPAIIFVKNNKQCILNKLESKTVFDLNHEERVKILQLLIHKMLTFSTLREHVDNAFVQISKLKRQIRDIQSAFNKWVKENSLKKNLTKTDSNSCCTKNEGNQVNDIQSQAPTVEQLEEYKREKCHKEEELLKNCSEVRKEIRKLQSLYGLRPIGFDRAYRRYWIFESVPALFVEHLIPDTSHTEQPFGPCLDQSTPTKSNKPNSLDEIQLQKDLSDKKDSSQRTLRDDSSTTSDKENEVLISHKSDDKSVDELLKRSCLSSLSHFDRCTANMETCSIHGTVNSDKRINWAFYYTSEQIEDLITTLNKRGFRECQLLSVLTEEKNAIIEMLGKCQPNKLNTDIPVPEVRKSQRLQEQLHIKGEKTFYSDYTSIIALEKALKDYLITLEEKLFAGSLGQVNKVSREEWKQMFERQSSSDHNLITSLRDAILILAESIRPFCISNPLNTETLNRWKESLKVCSNLSQLFVHLSTLDQSIKWSKSALKAYCKICRKKCDAEYMLLCDKCNRGHHTFCLQPSLDSVPHGEWFCPDCVPKFKPHSPVKQRSESLSDNSDIDSSDGEEFEILDDDMSSSEIMTISQISSSSRCTTPSKESTVCVVCKKSDTNLQLKCANCLDFYHKKCANVSRITRSDWYCFECCEDKCQRKRKQIKTDLSESDDEEESEKKSKRTKRLGRYSQDSDYLNDDSSSEHNQQSSTSSRRRYDKSSAYFRKSLPLDFGLCEDILKKLQKHSDGWLFMSRPNHAPKYTKVIKKYVDFGSLVSNLNMGKYTSNKQFFRDIFLMLSNATFYNRKNSAEYKACSGLSKYLETLLKEYDVDLKQDVSSFQVR